jgi:nicotinate-nucleotide adenylyltransferase
MKIALYFGSFNPIHHGHLIIANQIVEQENYNELWFVVSPQNPFKNEKNLLNANHRYHLLQLAIEGESKLKVSNIEFKLPKPSYTINTLVYLKEKFPSHEFDIVLGSDGFQNIKNWRNASFILKNYKIIIYKRPGFEIVNDTEAEIKEIVGPQLLISSTYIRGLLVKNKSIKFLVPDIVNDEIKARGFYNLSKD